MDNFNDIINDANLNKESNGPHINPAEYESITCDNCGCALFRSAVIIKKIPGLLVMSSHEYEYIPDNILVCNNCGMPMKKDREFYKLDQNGCHTEDLNKDNSKDNTNQTNIII